MLMLYFRKRVQESHKNKNIAIFIFLKNEKQNRKTGITKLFAKRPLLMIIIENMRPYNEPLRLGQNVGFCAE
jgi:hypothetical protein